MNDLAQRLTSRKFLLALAACVYVLIQAAGGTITAQQAVDGLEKVVGAYLAAEGLADVASRYGDSRAMVAEQNVREAAAIAATSSSAPRGEFASRG